MGLSFQGRARCFVPSGIGQKIVQFVLLALPGFLLGTGPLSAGEISLVERLSILKESYPHAIKSLSGNELVMRNGSRIEIDDGQEKNHQEKLKSADIEDMLAQIYPLGRCVAGNRQRNFDPGRIRSDDFFRNLYGHSKQQAGKQMLKVKWFGKALRFSRVGGAARALQRVGDDLRRLGPDFSKYYRNTPGTTSWRKIAGTDRLSIHSFGAAIDIVSKFANYWRWGSGEPGNISHYRNRIPLKIVGVFERHGFIWGGKWYHYDTSHFEYRPELIAIGKLAEQRGCPRF